MGDEPSLVEQRATAGLLKSLFPIISKAARKEVNELRRDGQVDLGDALEQAIPHLRALVLTYYDMTTEADA